MLPKYLKTKDVSRVHSFEWIYCLAWAAERLFKQSKDEAIIIVDNSIFSQNYEIYDEIVFAKYVKLWRN